MISHVKTATKRRWVVVLRDWFTRYLRMRSVRAMQMRWVWIVSHDVILPGKYVHQTIDCDCTMHDGLWTGFTTWCLVEGLCLICAFSTSFCFFIYSVLCWELMVVWKDDIFEACREQLFAKVCSNCISIIADHSREEHLSSQHCLD